MNSFFPSGMGSGKAPAYKGGYDSTKSYRQNETVSVAGSVYIALKSVPIGIDTTNPEYWTLYQAAGAASVAIDDANVNTASTTLSALKIREIADGKINDSNASSNSTTYSASKIETKLNNKSKVTDSATNGNIVVDGQEIVVYDDTTLKNASHSHSNKSTLDKFSENGSGLLFNGSPIVSGGGSSSDSESNFIVKGAITTTGTKTFQTNLHKFYIHNTGNSDITFTINSIAIVVKASEKFDGVFDPFTQVIISGSSTFVAEVYSLKSGSSNPQYSIKDYFSGSANTTRVYTGNVFGLTVSNDGASALTYTANGITITVPSGEVSTRYFDGFTQVVITSSVAYRVCASSSYNVAVTGSTSGAADTTAPTVTASVAGGTYTSAQTVTLSANETATIYYTLDGTTPTTSSTVYSSSLTINSTTTLKFFGRDTAGNNSAVQTNIYTINLPDTTPPSAVTGLTATNTIHNSVDLSWNVSTDNVGVTGYNIYRDGDLVTTVAGTTYQLTGLVASTTYSISVRARDAANNLSTETSISVTTSAAPSDSTPPNEVTGLTATPAETTVDLSWTASDSVDIAGYNVYDGATKKNGTLVTGTTYTVTGLTASTAYTFTVKAVDTSNNESTGINVSTTTTAPSDGAYRLNLNGSDTGIKLPPGVSMTHIEIEVNIFSLNTSSTTNNGYLVDFRAPSPGLTNGYVFNGGVGSGIEDYYIDGVAGTDKTTHWANIPKDVKATLKYGRAAVFTTTNTSYENTLFKRSNMAEGWLRVDVYKVRLYNGATAVAEYDFTNQFEGTTVTDQTGNERHATILGTGYSWVTG